MPLVKIKEKFQVTIPASIRKTIELDVGDLLEAELREDGILLVPKTVTNRKGLLNKLRKRFSEPVSDNPYAGKTDDEIMDIAIKTVKEARAEKKSKGR